MAKRDEIRIEYDGKYPNLCSGKLVVYIGKEKWEFPKYCLLSGGNVYQDDDGYYVTEEGEWYINKWPKEFLDDDGLKMLVMDVINDEIPLGCCGGCA